MSIKKLDGLVNTLSTYLDKKDVVNAAISKGSVGWHLQHSFMVVSKIIYALKQSNPTDYKSKFSFIKTIVFTLNKIPRGRGKAPKVVLPNDIITIDDLKKDKQTAIETINTLDTINANNYFLHPYFGNLKRKDTIKFLNIHTQHHLNIINDILTK